MLGLAASTGLCAAYQTASTPLVSGPAAAPLSTPLRVITSPGGASEVPSSRRGPAERLPAPRAFFERVTELEPEPEPQRADDLGSGYDDLGLGGGSGYDAQQATPGYWEPLSYPPIHFHHGHVRLDPFDQRSFSLFMQSHGDTPCRTAEGGEPHGLHS